MALVVFLRGLNVGGHRSFRPATLAKQLQHPGAINIGAAGTLVIRQPISGLQLRAEIRHRLPFDAEIMICKSTEILRLMSHNFFAGHPKRSGTVRFVSVLSRLPRSEPSLPMKLPSTSTWMLNILAREGRFVIGLYRRRMKTIGYLGELDRLFGAQVTTRSWNTITAIAKVLEIGRSRRTPTQDTQEQAP